MYNDKFIFSLQYYVVNNDVPYIYIPFDYFPSAEIKQRNASAKKWLPRIKSMLTGGDV